MIGVVPARGGSKGLRHKNLLTIDGIPLVINAAIMLQEYCEKVLVCTEDDQIASVTRLHGYEVVGRPERLATDEATVDELMRWFIEFDPSNVPILMHQPTVYSPTTYLHEFYRQIVDGRTSLNHVMVTPLNHITWPTANSSAPRLQRQDASDYPAREIGVRYYGRKTGGWNPIPIPGPIFDIDTPYDLDAARRASMRKGRVSMQYIETPEVGQGHRRRVEAIADELQHLDVELFPGWASGDHPSVVVHDMLDSFEAKMANYKAKGAAIVTLEDLGPGIRHADVVINALYDKAHAPYAVLRPEFRSLPPFEVKDSIENILVTFGGTDPSHYTERVMGFYLDPIAGPKIRVVIPPGRSVPEFANAQVSTVSGANMAEEMAWADLVITSAGRTIFEAGAVGVPALCVAHNLREARHAHLGPASGNIFMGLGLDGEVLDRNIDLLQSRRLREEMSEAGRKLTDGRGAERIARIVEDLL